MSSETLSVQCSARGWKVNPAELPPRYIFSSCLQMHRGARSTQLQSELFPWRKLGQNSRKQLACFACVKPSRHHSIEYLHILHVWCAGLNEQGSSSICHRWWRHLKANNSWHIWSGDFQISIDGCHNLGLSSENTLHGVSKAYSIEKMTWVWHPVCHMAKLRFRQYCKSDVYISNIRKVRLWAAKACIPITTNTWAGRHWQRHCLRSTLSELCRCCIYAWK